MIPADEQRPGAPRPRVSAARMRVGVNERAIGLRRPLVHPNVTEELYPTPWLVSPSGRCGGGAPYHWVLHRVERHRVRSLPIRCVNVWRRESGRSSVFCLCDSSVKAWFISKLYRGSSPVVNNRGSLPIGVNDTYPMNALGSPAKTRLCEKRSLHHAVCYN